MDGASKGFHVRPRFSEVSAMAAADFIKNLKKASKIHDCEGVFLEHHVVLKIKQEDQHFWSPQLNLEVKEEEGETKIRGLYGPKPGVWTMFVFFYSAIGFLSVMALMYGFSQMMLNMSHSGLWMALVGMVLLLGIYLTSAIGQRLGRDQMLILEKVVKTALAS